MEKERKNEKTKNRKEDKHRERGFGEADRASSARSRAGEEMISKE